MWKLVTLSLHCSSLFFSRLLLSKLTNQVCDRTLSGWRLSLPGIYEEAMSNSRKRRGTWQREFCRCVTITAVRMHTAVVVYSSSRVLYRSIVGSRQ